MRRTLTLCLACALTCALGILSCGDQLAGGASETGNAGVGTLRVDAYDSPPPADVAHIYLQFVSVDVHSEEHGWLCADSTARTVDFVSLLNGAMARMVDTTLPVGLYDEIRIMLGEDHAVVVGDSTYGLVVPSGIESGVRVAVTFAIAEDETTSLYLDFDAAASISWGDGEYRMSPSFSATEADQCGTVSGTVEDESGAVRRAVVQAVAGADTLATLTDSHGEYQLVLPAGVYDILGSADGHGVADTVYEGLGVTEGESVTGVDFFLSP